MNKIIYLPIKSSILWLLKKISKGLLKTLSNKLLCKWYPFSKDALFISFKSGPTFYIKENENICKYFFTISIKNHTDYDIILHNIEVKIILNHFELFNIAKSVWKEIKIKQEVEFKFEKSLTKYEVKKISDLFGSCNAINGKLEYEIFLENILGNSTIKSSLENKFEIIK